MEQQPQQKKKKGSKKKKTASHTQGGFSAGLTQPNANALSAGEKFLTPSIEFYKNKTLTTLSINQPGATKPEYNETSNKGQEAKRLNFGNSLAPIQEFTDSASSRQGGVSSQPYMMQHSKDLRSTGYGEKSSGALGGQASQQSLLSSGQMQNDYSTANILKNAKTEKLMLDIEQFKVRTKKEFVHEVQAKDEINNYFGKMNDIEQLVGKVADSVSQHRKDFFDRFKGEIHKESTNENLNKLKLKKEILDRQAERDWFKNECNKIDGRCHERQDELTRCKDKHNELLQEKKFLDEQIMTARENKINLARRKQELLDELNELKEGENNFQDCLILEGGQPDADINSGLVVREPNPNGLNSLRNNKGKGSPGKAREDPNYFENSVQKLKDFISHLHKRNEVERRNAMRKQLQSEKIEEANYPFEIIFQDSLQQVKEEIVERRHKSQRRGMNTSKSALSIRQTADPQAMKTPDNLQDHFQHKSIFNKFSINDSYISLKFDLEIDHVKAQSFTESDKKKVMENFMGNEEVLFFIYGLLFPQSVMAMQQQQSIQQDESIQQ